MAPDILGRKNPGRVTLVPFQISLRKPSSHTIENCIVSKSHGKVFNCEPDIESPERRKVSSSEILKTSRGEMMRMSGISVRIMGTEMRRYEKQICPITRDSVQFLHHRWQILNVLDDMRQVDSVERIAFDGPGKPVQIPDDIRNRARVYVNADCGWFDFARAAADI
jgi:hypothetical protein